MNRGRDWLAGATIGASGGFLLVYALPVGLVLLVGFGVGVAVSRSMAAAGGLFFCSGGVILLMFLLANANCSGLYGSEDGARTPPDLTGWLAAGLLMALAGVGFTSLAIARRRLG